MQLSSVVFSPKTTQSHAQERGNLVLRNYVLLSLSFHLALSKIVQFILGDPGGTSSGVRSLWLLPTSIF